MVKDHIIKVWTNSRPCDVEDLRVPPGLLRLSHPRRRDLRFPRRSPQHDPKEQPTPVNIMFLVEDSQPEPLETEQPAAKGAKVTQRMLQLRELIAEGAYPDKDELAERIVDKL